MKRLILSALLPILIASLAIGCGEINKEEEARIAATEEAQKLVDVYVNYLNTENPDLINQISELYPECVTETEQGKRVDESTLLNYANSFEVELSRLNEYYETLFDSNKYPLQEGESYYYSGPTYNEQTHEWYTTPLPVSFNLEGPWDFSQGPTDETLIVTTKNASNDPNHADFPGATYVTYKGWQYGTDSRFYSKDTNIVQEHGWVEDVTYLGRNIYIYKYDVPNFLVCFPIKVGQVWENNFSIIRDGKPIATTSRKKTVISKNRLVVPAGTYDDAYLVQVKGSQTFEGVNKTFCNYIWYIPYIGMVVYIGSLDNEPNEVYVQAQLFERLKFTTYAKPEKIGDGDSKGELESNENE